MNDIELLVLEKKKGLFNPQKKSSPEYFEHLLEISC